MKIGIAIMSIVIAFLVAAIAVVSIGWFGTSQELALTQKSLGLVLEMEATYSKQNTELREELDTVRGVRDFAQSQEKIAYERLDTTFAELREVRENLAAAQEKLLQGTITGRAYIDRNFNDALENYPDDPIKGLKINLYKVIHDLETEKVSYDLLSTTEVDDQGMYKFDVSPGTYYVTPVTYIEGYPPWQRSVWLKAPGYIEVSEGEKKAGPIFLVSNPTTEKR